MMFSLYETSHSWDWPRSGQFRTALERGLLISFSRLTMWQSHHPSDGLGGIIT